MPGTVLESITRDGQAAEARPRGVRLIDRHLPFLPDLRCHGAIAAALRGSRAALFPNLEAQTVVC